MRSTQFFLSLALASAMLTAGCGGGGGGTSAGGASGSAQGGGGSGGTSSGGSTGAGGSASSATGGQGGGTTKGGSTGNAGTGGRTSTPGGSGGQSGTPGGDAGTQPAAGCGIPCLADIDKDCTGTGACVESNGLLGPNRCYANGVKVITSADLTTLTYSITQSKDGKVCYTTEAKVSGTSIAITWKDKGGKTVATGTYDTKTMMPTVMCGAQSFDATAGLGCSAAKNIPSLPGAPAQPSTCTMGSCM